MYLMLFGLLAAEHGGLLEVHDHCMASLMRAHSQRSLVRDDQVSAHQTADVGRTLQQKTPSASIKWHKAAARAQRHAECCRTPVVTSLDR